MSPVLVAALLLAFAGGEPEAMPAPAEVRAAISRGIDFLLQSQNADGSWGGVRNATFVSGFGNPGTYHCWMVGTTALATQAVLEVGSGEKARGAADRGLGYLIANARLVRPAEWDTDNTWGLVFGLNTLARALGHPRYANTGREKDLRVAAETVVAGLKRYQSPRGGWGYYADPGSAWRPDWATSFTTAVGLLALVEARRVGLDVDDKVFDAARRAVERTHLPNGAYDYDVSAIPRHMRLESINQVKGSLGRIQVGNLALYRAGGKLREGDLEWGIGQFFEHHKFLDVARNKPIPHEAYYANAAYFYLFGHYYAAQVLEALPGDVRARFAPQLQREVMKCQQRDGSMWDFWIASCTRPYGTAFGVMALAKTVPPAD